MKKPLDLTVKDGQVKTTSDVLEQKISEDGDAMADSSFENTESTINSCHSSEHNYSAKEIRVPVHYECEDWIQNQPQEHIDQSSSGNV